MQASSKSKVLAGVIVTVGLAVIPVLAYVLTQFLLPSVRALMESFGFNLPAGAPRVMCPPALARECRAARVSHTLHYATLRCAFFLFAAGSFWFVFIAMLPLCAVAASNAFLMLTSRFVDEKKKKKKKLKPVVTTSKKSK